MSEHFLSTKLSFSGPEPSENKQENQGFDQILFDLRHIVTQLELGNLSLEQALHMFEQGVRISRKGAEILSAAEHRIDLLVQDEVPSFSEDLEHSSKKPEDL